mmetsp:Transcript_29273/g.57472  ORF Transcript_29273/g.57472 Transcript_29273/m.57472 type:complete len:189 (-) Transcript_29273:172-738(-)|eukprot:CAMPEP_0175108456 /NCGR_PEP_ID=MMETSP0086_2-20121207/12659_1 /TAXON_ID=136419 /ORGANISM="Unknown Unknown, Strain D1" /LENGTH=188 /DNA_ID=CAMNT_0016385693 /DNA_START=26 /DNA_END=592 /DNA_ORIENTATION=+
MNTGYYEIDDIVAEDEQIPCIFNVDAVDLGYLDENSNDEDIKKDSKIPLPFWLTQVLATRNMVTPTLPKCFGNRFRESLLADPKVVDLNDENEYFYELGAKLVVLARDPDIADMLKRSLASRYQEIIKRDHTYRSIDFTQFTSRLTNMEMRLMNSIQEGVKNRKAHSLSASSSTKLAQRTRKRSAADL